MLLKKLIVACALKIYHTLKQNAFAYTVFLMFQKKLDKSESLNSVGTNLHQIEFQLISINILFEFWVCELYLF